MFHTYRPYFIPLKTCFIPIGIVSYARERVLFIGTQFSISHMIFLAIIPIYIVSYPGYTCHFIPGTACFIRPRIVSYLHTWFQMRCVWPSTLYRKLRLLTTQPEITQSDRIFSYTARFVSYRLLHFIPILAYFIPILGINIQNTYETHLVAM